MIDGILLVDKEAGISSYDVIRKLKKFLPKKQKVGHAGTLDPFATGLLIILLGKGTKLMSRFLILEKEYIVKAEFGYETDTQDRDGKITKEINALEKISRREISKIIKTKFLGEIDQIPPIFSAKKIRGKKAYELAREGQKIDLPSKKIEIKEFKIKKYNWPCVEFEIKCSSGTYIRTLIRDLGRELNSLATAVELRRTCIGDFNVKEAVDVKDFSLYTSDSVKVLDNLGRYFDER